MPTIPVLLALVGTAEATNVNVSWPNTVSAAVATLVGPGPHTVNIITDGTYDEPDTIDIGNMNVTIIGTGSDTTVIRIPNTTSDAVFRTTGGRLVLDSVGVTGSTGNAVLGVSILDALCSFADERVGVDAISGTVELYDSHLRCFYTLGNGGAVSASETTIYIQDTEFDQNVAIGAGGHVYAGGSTIAPPSLDVINSEFTFGFSGSDGGAIAAGNVDPHISGSTFRFNDAVVQGGAVSISNAATGDTAEIYQNTFDQNFSLSVLSYVVAGIDDVFDTGEFGGGAVNFSLITGEGGGVYVDSQGVDLWANLFCGNAANNGAGARLEDPLNTVIQNNVFNDNWAIHFGGGVYTYADSGAGAGANYPLVNNNTFHANSAGVGLPPIEGLVVYGGGGAAFFDGTVADFQNNIVSNQLHGGGVTGVDGANYVIGDPLIMEYNLWFENKEDSGGNLNLVGDYAAHTLNQTNVIGDDPFPTFAGVGDLDCYPDAFYPVWGSPAINRGNPLPIWDDVDGTNNDIGFTGGPRATTLDRDGDGYMNTIDCDDTDAAVNPGANETCNLHDDDCDGEVDEGTVNTWFEDADGDGHGGTNGMVLVQCAPPVGFVAVEDDCDDGNPLVNPSQTEVCDGIDNNCSGTIDDEELLQYFAFYLDNDGDGYGFDASYVELCADPGLPYTAVNGDCDDTTAARAPGLPEQCDGIDNDCNLLVDDGAVDASTWYTDVDGDGYGSGTGVVACDGAQPIGSIAVGGDCDESSVAVNPGAPEVCDEKDNDCNGEVDDDPVDGNDYYLDVDGDGLVDEASKITTCDEEAPSGYTTKLESDEFDCDDSDEFNTSEDCTGGCACTTAPSPASGGAIGLLSLLVVGLRRRRD